MNFINVVFIALGLSMDAFAVSVTRGMVSSKLSIGQANFIAGCFGVFQGIMPVIGYFIGKAFSKYINEFDHWIAFILLGIIGIKMVYEALKKNEPDKKSDANEKFSVKFILLLGVATSIDALAVGLSFAFLDENIFIPALTICLVTYAISFAGVYIGKKFGGIFKKYAEVIGGSILVLIGTKILVEHLFFNG